MIRSSQTELPNSTTEPDIAEHVRKAYESAIPADSSAQAVAFAMSQPEEVERDPLPAHAPGVLALHRQQEGKKTRNH